MTNVRRNLKPANLTKQEAERLRSEWIELNSREINSREIRVISFVRTSPWWRFWKVENKAVEI